jgi:putative ABC transport system ATP-binding protein
MRMPVLIQVKNLSKTYVMGGQTVYALRDIYLDIQEGEFVAIMGTSGSGKSTLMNILGFLDQPTSGEYFFEGQAVHLLSDDELAHRRNLSIGFVFQQFHLLGRTTALENVELPMLYAGVSAAQRHQRAQKALETVGLGQRLHHTPVELSGGQQQRVAIARALVNQPRIIFADEPTGALDSQTSADILRLLCELHQKKNITIILVTHDPKVAAWAQRIIQFQDGHIVKDELNVSASLG